MSVCLVVLELGNLGVVDCRGLVGFNFSCLILWIILFFVCFLVGIFLGGVEFFGVVVLEVIFDGVSELLKLDELEVLVELDESDDVC